MNKKPQAQFRLSVALPMPPYSGNHLHFHAARTSRFGKKFMGKFLKPDAAFWKENAGLMVKSAMQHAGLAMIFRSKFSADVKVFWRDKRSQCDCDGILKLPLDAMNGIAYSSDKFCLPRVLEDGYDESNPRLEILISCPPTKLVEAQ